VTRLTSVTLPDDARCCDFNNVLNRFYAVIVYRSLINTNRSSFKNPLSLTANVPQAEVDHLENLFLIKSLQHWLRFDIIRSQLQGFMDRTVRGLPSFHYTSIAKL